MGISKCKITRKDIIIIDMLNINNFLPFKKNKNHTSIVDQKLWLRRQNIKTFIDIGAFIGEYVDYAHRLYPEAKIYAFEPLKEAYHTLEDKKKHMNNLKIFNLALGETKMKSVIYRSSYPPSSSLLSMGSIHKQNFPHTAKLSKDYVIVNRLDDVLQEESLKQNIFIKIDTQGYEEKVIKGGKETIKKTSIIQTEVSFVPLYKKQALFDDIYKILTQLGFIFFGIRNQIISPLDGHPLQAHVYFINPKKTKA